MSVNKARGRALRKAVLCSSGTALALFFAQQADAQCAPDPTISGQTTTCDGVDVDGIAVTTSQSIVAVLPGANVQSAGAPAISVAIPADGNYQQRTATINVAGSVSGGAQAGISVVDGPLNGFYDYLGSAATINVTAGGSISGANGIVIDSSPGSQAYAFVILDNAGTITGSAGPALQTKTYWGGFNSITNEAGGYIGGIASGIATLNNAGTIDGGQNSAIADGYPQTLYGQGITNSGLITSSGSATTITNPEPYGVINSGTITNTGSGSAITDTGYLQVTNQSGGTVSAIGADTLSAPYNLNVTNSGLLSNLGGNAVITSQNVNIINNAGGIIASSGNAINASSNLSLINHGLITGNVLAGSASQLGYPGSVVYNVGGTIDGNLTFGDANDTLEVGYGAGGVQTGVTGTVDGGAGTNTLIMGATSDLTIDQPIALPTNFQVFGIVADAGTTVTIAQGASFQGAVALYGQGTIVNQASLSAAGTAVTSGAYISPDGSYTQPNFTNMGTITNTADGSGFAVSLNSVNVFTNTGTINSAADGVSLSSNTFSNTGQIVAVGTAAEIGGSFQNTGTIRSSGGTALVLFNNGYNFGPSTNSGLIDGATTGVALYSSLINTGTITSAGTAVDVENSGTLDNRAGGVVTGGTLAIQVSPLNGAYSGATVLNAGTINGDVDFGNHAQPELNRYFALPGGVLNGNLTLGNADILVTQLVNTGSGPFDGINGTVTANNASLRYVVDADADTTLNAPAGFANVGYDLYNSAALTLAAATPVAATLTFAGTGSVDLTADITSNSAPILQGGSVISVDGSYNPSNLSITSHGTLTLNRSDPNSYLIAAVNLGGGTFTNTGTLAVVDTSGLPSSQVPAAITGGSVINTGTITNNAGDGVYAVTSLDNSGTISVAGAAVDNSYYYGGTITNSGTLASTGGAAIVSQSFVAIENQAGGTISGTGPFAIQVSGGSIVNAGTINGSVNLGYSPYGSSYTSSIYTTDGGILNGNLTFGSGNDVLVETGGGYGVTGTIDGGQGTNLVEHERTTSGTVTVGGALLTNFQGEIVEASGVGTVITITAAAPISTGIYVGGNGQIVNQVSTSGSVNEADNFFYLPNQPTQTLASFDNEADIGGSIYLGAYSFSNSGNVGSAAAGLIAVTQFADTSLSFDNSGSITGGAGVYSAAVNLQGYAISTASISNSGTITGGLSAQLNLDSAAAAGTIAISNSGTITRGDAGATTVTFQPGYYPNSAISTVLTNTGTIEATGQSATALSLINYGLGNAISITNSGIIRSNGGGQSLAAPSDPYAGASTIYGPTTSPAAAIRVSNSYGETTIVNDANGRIEATGPYSQAILAFGSLTLTNAGTITGTQGFTVAANDTAAYQYGFTGFAGAIQTIGGDDSITNSGTITGSIDLGDGNDTFVNTGTIDGTVNLGDGDDGFTERASATLTGMVDGGAGFDTLTVDATGGGVITASQFVDFERLVQTGAGSVAYSGSFAVPTIELNGSTLTVAAGTTLQTTGPVAITGGSGAETVINAGAIIGGVSLGAGDDTYVDMPGSSVTGRVDGGAGNDTYQYVLAGDRTVTNPGVNFEELSVTGSGTLSYALNQSFASAQLAGTGLNLKLGGFTIGQITGSSGADSVTADGDLPSVSLGAGDDTLTLGAATAAGVYDGGAGTDVLTFTAPGPVTLSGKASGFETISLAGGALTVAGTLGAAGDHIAFGPSPTTLTIASGGTLAAAIQFGAGDDQFHIGDGAVITGPVDGGQGDNALIFDGTSNYTLTASVTGFSQVSLASGALTIAGTLGSSGQPMTFDDGDDTVTVAPGGTLAGQVNLGGGNDRLIIQGSFAGSVDGGKGTNSISTSAGTQAAPVAFTSITNVQSFLQSAGYATISGSASLGAVELSGGRLVGKAGSTIAASTIVVGQGATFGSAGTVKGDLSVAGTLSQSASPGTMAVTGNVALKATSTTVLAITSAQADKLTVSGSVSIAAGATLQLSASDITIKPGSAIDLIVANGGITGSFTNIIKPSSLFGFVIQQADAIEYLNQFQNSASFSPQVQRSINYANATLGVQSADSPLFAALPSLLEADGSSNPAAFAQLAPESYASATQMAVENGLVLGTAIRSMQFAPPSEDRHAFTFAQVLGNWGQLGADKSLGTARTSSNEYGFLGGIGFNSGAFAVGGFVGYLDNRESIAALGASTKADGVVAGVHARYTSGTATLLVSAFYDGATADTRRALPGGGSARGHYDLHGFGLDAQASTSFVVGNNIALTPSIGTTWVRADRGGVDETGGSPFALTVASNKRWAGFADAGLAISPSANKTLWGMRPWLSVGVRYQFEGRRVSALGEYADGGFGLSADGAARARVEAIVAAGLEAQVAPQVSVFVTGGGDFASRTTDGHANAGVKLVF
jgi:adhesin HecA-like repeat protein